MRTSPLAAAGSANRRGFAIVLDESEYLELIPRQGELAEPEYGAYLAAIRRRMSAARRGGARVLVGPFRADQHVSYAERIGAPPFGTIALRAFDDYVVRTYPDARQWRGGPIGRVVADLRAAERAEVRSTRTPAVETAGSKARAARAGGQAAPASRSGDPPAAQPVSAAPARRRRAWSKESFSSPRPRASRQHGSVGVFGRPRPRRGRRLWRKSPCSLSLTVGRPREPPRLGHVHRSG